LTSLVCNVGNPVALVFWDLSRAKSRVGVHSEVAVFVNTSEGLMACLHNILQARVPSQAERLTGSHVSKLRHQLLQETKASGSLSSLSAGIEDYTASLGSTERLI